MIRVVHPGYRILIFTRPGSRITQGPKRHRIPDPDHFEQNDGKYRYLVKLLQLLLNLTLGGSVRALGLLKEEKSI